MPRQSARDAEKDIERYRGRETPKERQTKRQRKTKGETEKETHKETEKYREQLRDPHTETEGETKTQRYTQAQKTVKRMEIKRKSKQVPRGKNQADGAVHFLLPSPPWPQSWGPGSSWEYRAKGARGMVFWAVFTAEETPTSAASLLPENSRPHGCALQSPVLCT